MVDKTGNTPADIAHVANQPVLAAWLNAVQGWSQLRVAAGCRLRREAAVLLRLGEMDPDAFPPRELLAAIETSGARDPWPWLGVSPVCRATAKLVADAARGWHRSTHWLHHCNVRMAVYTVLVVELRLQDAMPQSEKGGGGCGESGGGGDGDGDGDCNGGGWHAVGTGAGVTSGDWGPAAELEGLPVLPSEIWLFMMHFFLRSWWTVTVDRTANLRNVGPS